MKRRDFLKASAPFAVLPAFMNGMTLRAFAKAPGLESLLGSAVETDHVLVLVQLNGGNDGLNTLIPLDQYSNLSKARPAVLIDEKKVLKLDGLDGTGLHPAMTHLRDRFNEGQVTALQGVGYPNPNFSHFRSTDIWMTGSDSDEVLTSGWIGRYLTEEYPNFPEGYPNSTMPDPLAIQIGSIVSPVCQGLSVNMGLAISDPSAFYQLITGDYGPVPNTRAGKELEYIRRIADQTNEYAKVVKSASEKATNKSDRYPEARQNTLADQLKIVAQLIAGGLKTRVYIVSIGGFDTHANQVDPNSGTEYGQHANLLGNVSEAIDAFMHDCELLGIDERVIGMTFSEFGRRIISNFSNGTDHGSSAPMFLFGKKVKAGMLGTNPQIPANATAQDNLPMQYDFRAMYASVLKDWFCLEDSTVDSVMLNDYQYLPLLQESCLTSSVHEMNRRAGDAYVMNYPNPFRDHTKIRFESQGEHVLLQVFDTQGRMIDTLVNAVVPKGEHEVVFSASLLPSGTYYYRYQSGFIQQTKSMLKIH
jgi:uncharacterized protein (DUF1501 family)